MLQRLRRAVGLGGWAKVCSGLDSPPQTPPELKSQTDRLSPANASVPSGEQLRRTLAKVDRLLREMRARDLGAPRALADAELGEAQRREWCGPRRAGVGGARTQPGAPELRSAWSGITSTCGDRWGPGGHQWSLPK